MNLKQLKALKNRVFAQSILTSRFCLFFFAFMGCVFSIAMTAHAGSWDGAPPGYGIAWSDEFNGAVGSLPKAANWTIESNSNGEGNAELEYYSSSYGTANCVIASDPNAVDGQSLAIIATDPGGNNGVKGDYHSARLDTNGKANYGANQANTYYVARIKMPIEQGTWPAFWTLGSNYGSVGWPTCGETDIMENFGLGAGQLNTNMGSLHANWDDAGTWTEVSQTAQYHLMGPGTIGYNTDYHTFAALSYTPTASVTELQFFVDGQLYETDATGMPAGVWPFDQTEYIILNLAIGGDRGTGQPNSSTTFPVTMLVDYVRVYQQGSPTPTPVVQSSWYVACGQSSNYISGTSGITWVADTNFGFKNGLPTYTTSMVSNTTDSQLYQYNRYTNTGTGVGQTGVTYTFSVPAGSYQVTLKFAEDFFGASGDREFNYSINGATEATNFDIYKDSGGEYIADDKVYSNISSNANGQIVIALTNGSKDNAQINAIQIVPYGTPFTATNTPTLTPTSTPTATVPTSTPTHTPVNTSTPTITNTPTITFTPTNTDTPNMTPTSAVAGKSAIFPNPAKGVSEVTLAPFLTGISDVRVQIYTTAFRKVLDTTFPQTSPGQYLTLPLLDASDRSLANGLYYVMVTTAQGKTLLKLIVLW